MGHPADANPSLRVALDRLCRVGCTEIHVYRRVKGMACPSPSFRVASLQRARDVGRRPKEDSGRDDGVVEGGDDYMAEVSSREAMVRAVW